MVLRERCFVCGKSTGFYIDDGATLLREARCENCGASIRNSDLAKAIVNVIIGRGVSLREGLDQLQGKKILEAQSCGAINNLLRSVSGFVCFEYFDGVKPGTDKNGILCNDLEALTFRDNSFDLVITQDVLEHVVHPNRALAEIFRVLKRGGYHMFTVPLHEGRPTLSRAGLPKVYHGDPLRKEGALVSVDWGDDICSLVDSYGFNTRRIDVHMFYDSCNVTNVDESYSEYLSVHPMKYYRYNSIVFVSQKKAKGFFGRLVDKFQGDPQKVFGLSGSSAKAKCFM